MNRSEVDTGLLVQYLTAQENKNYFVHPISINRKINVGKSPCKDCYFKAIW